MWEQQQSGRTPCVWAAGECIILRSFSHAAASTLTVLQKPGGMFKRQPSLCFVLLYNALVSDSVEPIRPRCDVWAGSRHEREKGSSGRPEAGGGIFLSIFQIPQLRRMRRKHWGISVAYFHTFAYFSKSDSQRQTMDTNTHIRQAVQVKRSTLPWLFKPCRGVIPVSMC